MTMSLLLALIHSFCDGIKDKEDRISCYDSMVNCSIVSNGNILSLEDFAKKCKMENK